MHQAFTGAGYSQFVFESNAVLNAAEAPIIQAFEDARPSASQETAYALWFQKYIVWHDIAFAATAEPMYANFATRMGGQRPAARADKDYLTFLVGFDEHERAVYTSSTITDRALDSLDFLAATRPRGEQGEAGGGSRSYAPWFQLFGARYGDALGSDAVITDAEKVRLDRFNRIRPCTTNLAADLPLWDNLNARRANFGAAVTYFDAAKPVSCE